MDPSTIRHHLGQSPFRPFSVRMVNGDRVAVKKREWAMMTPHGDTLIVFTGKKVGDDYEMKLLHVPWVEEIQPRGRTDRDGRRNGHR